MPHVFAFYADGNSVFMAGEDFVRKPDETILRAVDVCGAVHAQSGVAVAAFSVRKTESRSRKSVLSLLPAASEEYLLQSEWHISFHRMQ